MSFLVYFAVIVVAAASALFGLDLLTAPLPDKPSAQMASAQGPSKLAQREADKKEAIAHEASKDDDALTPVFLASPGGKKDVRMVYPPSNETTGAGGESDELARAQESETMSAPSASAQPQPQQVAEQTAAVQPQRRQLAPEQTEQNVPAPQAQAKAEPPAATATPAAQPVVQQSSNRCDVAACAAAYNSFRASDCTYQPFDGPRRICERTTDAGQQKSAERASPRMPEPRLGRAAREARPARTDAELRAVAERVKELTAANDLEQEDIDGAPMRGRRVIVIERGYDGWR